MNAFEKIIERLKNKHIPYLGLDNSVPYGTEMVKLFEAIEIVNQVAEEYSLTGNAEWITLPKVAFDRMIARMESESERDIYEEESLFINVRDAANIVFEIAREYSNPEIPNMSEDVCEWFKYDYRTIAPKNHNADNPYWRIPENMDKLKFCPYCGKEIKVVE